MVTMPAQEIKRRGIGAMDADLAAGPVYIIRNNTPRYVVMLADAFREMEANLTAARVAAAEAEYNAGQFTRGTADDLMSELAEA